MALDRARPAARFHQRQPRLYWALTALAALGVSTQVFLPYLLIYLQRYLRIEAYALVLGVVLTGAAVISVLGGRVIDRVESSTRCCRRRPSTSAG